MDIKIVLDTVEITIEKYKLAFPELVKYANIKQYQTETVEAILAYEKKATLINRELLQEELEKYFYTGKEIFDEGFHKGSGKDRADNLLVGMLEMAWIESFLKEMNVFKVIEKPLQAKKENEQDAPKDLFSISYCSDNSIEFRNQKTVFPFPVYDLFRRITNLRETIVKEDVCAFDLQEYPDKIFKETELKNYPDLSALIYNIIESWITEIEISLHNGDKKRLFDSFLKLCEEKAITHISDKDKKNANKTIGFQSSFPANLDPNDDWETHKRKCEIHNQTIYREYEDNLERAKKTMRDLVSDMLSSTNLKKQIADYDLLGRRISQIKSIYLQALNMEVDKGCTIEDVENHHIQIKFDELMDFYKKSISDLDTHVKTLNRLKNRDCKDLESNSNATQMQPKNDVNNSVEIVEGELTDNNFTLSTIEDWLFEFKNKMTDTDYQTLVSAITNYFDTGLLP